MPLSCPPSLKCLQNPTLPWYRSTGTFASPRVSDSALWFMESLLTDFSIVPPSSPGSTSSALLAVDVNIFAHEFINIFRFSHQTTVHPADIQVVNTIDDDSVRCEEDSARVFLSKDVMERFSDLTAYRPVKPIRQRQSRMRHAPRSTRAPLPSPASTPVLSQFSYPVR